MLRTLKTVRPKYNELNQLGKHADHDEGNLLKSCASSCGKLMQ